MSDVMTSTQTGRDLGLSPLSTMVNGYGGIARTIGSMDDVWNWRVLHPEMKRREFALFFSDPRTVRNGFDADGLAILSTPLGNGSSGRGTGPAAIANFWSRNSRTYLAGRPSRYTPEGWAWLKQGYAPIAYPGGSNHEDDTFEGYGMATDAVGWADGWMGRNVDRFGLRTFWNVGSEPWHLQPAGYGASKTSLQSDLAIHGLPTIDLPAIPGATPPAPPTRIEIEDDMINFEIEAERIYDSRADGQLIPGAEPRKVSIGKMSNVFGGPVGVIRTEGDGYVTVAGTRQGALDGKTSVATFDADGRANGYVMCGAPEGFIYVAAHAGPCDVTIDLNVWGGGDPS